MWLILTLLCILDTKFGATSHRNITKLKAKIVDEWDKFDKDEIACVIAQACVAAVGGYFQ